MNIATSLEQILDDRVVGIPAKIDVLQRQQ